MSTASTADHRTPNFTLDCYDGENAIEIEKFSFASPSFNLNVLNRLFMLARFYLRASTDEQDATRVRPELFRLLGACHPGDVLLVEQVDRLSRLTASNSAKLRAEIDAKQIRFEAPPYVFYYY